MVVPMLTVAETTAALSESLAVAEVMREIGVLLDAAGLSVLSVKVAPAPAVIDSVGTLSSDNSHGAALALENVRNVVGAPPLRLPTQISSVPISWLEPYDLLGVGSIALALKIGWVVEVSRKTAEKEPVGFAVRLYL